MTLERSGTNNMPCRDYRDDYKVIDHTETYKALRDQLARIACKACTRLEQLGLSSEFDKETSDWWTQHKMDDAKAQKARIAAERAENERKRAARAKREVDEIAQLKKLQAKYRGKV